MFCKENICTKPRISLILLILFLIVGLKISFDLTSNNKHQINLVNQTYNQNNLKKMGDKFTQSLSKVYIDNEEGVFRDVNGSMIIFHGVNVVFKSHPYLPQTEYFDP